MAEEKGNKFWKWLGVLFVGGLVGFGVFAISTEPKVVTDIKYVDKPVVVPADNILVGGVAYTAVDIQDLIDENKEFQTSADVDEGMSLEDLRDDAADYVLEEIRDDYNMCSGIEYDDEEITLSDINDNWDIDIDDAEDNEYIVSGTVKIKYKDEDKCYNIFDFEVEYDGDDVDVNIL